MNDKMPSILLFVAVASVTTPAGAAQPAETGLLYLSCEYDRPAAVKDASVDLIVDLAHNGITTSLDCKATDVRINDAHIAFACGDDFSMNVDRLTGGFDARLAKGQHGLGRCLKIKKPKF